MGKWTRADVNQLRALMTAQGRSIDEVADEIRHLCGCSKLAAYRMAHGWSQPDAVERYKQATGGAMDQPLLSKLERFPLEDSRAPLACEIIGLAMVYATTPLGLVGPHTLERLDPHERSLLVRCNAGFVTPVPSPDLISSGRVDSLEPSETEDACGARRVRPANGRLELERQVTMAARKALRFSVAVEGSNVGPETLEQLREEVARLANACRAQPFPTLLGDLVEAQDIAFRLLEGRQRPGQTRELYFLAGVVSGMVAHASHSLGDPHAAMTQARTAYVCADNAGHDGLRASVRGQQSIIAYWAGWPHEAVRYAQLGADAAARVTGSVSVFLPAMAARAHAMLGDGEESRAAAERARGARERVTLDELDDIVGAFTWPKQLYCVADATVWLAGEEERAEREAAEAVDAYEHADEAERSYAEEAVARADLALARTGLGELDGAREALRPVLDLPPAQRLAGIVTRTFQVHAALRDPRYHGSAAARETQEEIEALCHAAAGVLPR